MKWYDKLFLTYLIIGILSTIIVTIKVYEHSIIAAYFGLIMGLCLSVAVVIDWKSYRRRHNLRLKDIGTTE